MHAADKAVLKLAVGLGLAALLAYGLELNLPFMVCLMTVLILTKPGPPLPLLKGMAAAVVFAGLVAMGIFMVALLENYRTTGVLLTAVILYAQFFFGLVRGNPLTLVFVIAFTMIPVKGVAEQALVPIIALALASGIAIGTLVNSLWNALFPDPGGPARQAQSVPAVSRETARWIALRATLIVMPVFILALTDPSFYFSAILQTVALGQQAGATNARSAGRQLVGSTLAGAGLAAVLWAGLSMWPTLWMLVLWMTAAGLWAGARMYGVMATAFPPSFWANALTTMLILLGPAIEDSDIGKDVSHASAMRVCLFVGIALYAWATVWVLERWRARRSRRLFFDRG